jgi:hypothetical protein
MDIVKRLRYEAKTARENHPETFCVSEDTAEKAADEIERLRNNAKQDAQYLLAYHRICQKHGIAPSSSDFLEALKEKE